MIRDVCVFARQDLTKDPPFSHLDLILCRNVLIYMDAVLQKKLLSVFHYALNPGGFLVLDQAETVGAQATLFTLVDKRLRIHRKKDSAVPPAMSFPVGTTGRVVLTRSDGPGGAALAVNVQVLDAYDASASRLLPVALEGTAPSPT